MKHFYKGFLEDSDTENQGQETDHTNGFIL